MHRSWSLTLGPALFGYHMLYGACVRAQRFQKELTGMLRRMQGHNTMHQPMLRVNNAYQVQAPTLPTYLDVFLCLSVPMHA